MKTTKICSRCKIEKPIKGKIFKKKDSKIHIKRERAHKLLYYFCKKGIIKKEPCKICGSEQKIEAHHTDYNYPLFVFWLCQKCHLDLHINQTKLYKKIMKNLTV